MSGVCKTCSKCGELKPLDEFYSSGKKFLRSECKSCKRKYEKNRRKNPYCKACGVVFVRETTERYCKECRPLRTVINSRRGHLRWKKENPEKHRVKSLGFAKRCQVEMRNNYISKILLQLGFTKDKITPDLIAAERALIKLKRAVKEIEA